MFVFSPELLLIAESPLYIIYCCLSAVVGVKFFSNFITGYFFNKKLNPIVPPGTLRRCAFPGYAGLVTEPDRRWHHRSVRSLSEVCSKGRKP
jgi:hypothetical protein